MSCPKLGRIRADRAKRPAIRLEIAKFLFIAAVLVGLSGCADDGADSGDANTDTPLYIECFEGETAATETSEQQLPPKADEDDDEVEWPEGMPACPPFDDTMFFATPPIEVYEQFAEAVFPAKSIPCTVFLDGSDTQFDCLIGPAVELTWTWPDGRFPFDNGDVVRLYMEYGAYDPPTYSMAVFGLDESLLVLATPDYHMFSSPQIDCRDVDAGVETDYACEYQLADAPPRNWPEDDGVSDWTRVFGHSVSGQFMDLAWALENPADVATTEDGGYLAMAPVAYMGTFFRDDDIVEKGEVGRHEFRLQLVRLWD